MAITVTVPVRVGYDYRIVRTYNGSAEHPTAGLPVSSGVVGSTEFTVIDGSDNFEDADSANDVDLSSGWVYYTLFVFDDNAAWIKEAATSVVLPSDRGTLDYLINALPSVYTSADGNPITPPDQDSDLMRFLSSFTLTYDEMAASVDNVLPDVRSKATIRRLHDAYATGVGMPSEYTIGVAATARLYRESGYIYRNKGTVDGISTYVEAITGWQTTVTESPNLFLSLNDSSFESTIGNWSVTGGTLTRVVVNTPTVTSAASLYSYDAVVGPWSKEAVGEVTLTSSSATLNLPTSTSQLLSIPVSEGTSYRFAVPVRAISGTPTVTVSIRWHSQSGTLLSTSSASPYTTTSSWTSTSVTGTAPANALYAAVRVVVSGSSGNVIHLDMLSFVNTADFITGSFVYRDPRSVNILCEPARINLIKDPSFDSAIGTYWSATTGTLTKDTSQHLVGVSSGKIVGTPFEFRSHTMPVTAGETYSVRGAARGTGSASLNIRWLTSSSTLISVSTVSFSALSSNWQTVEGSFGAPPNATQAVVSITGSGTAYVDTVSFEPAEQIGVYFDGATSDASGADSSWIGTAPGSYSILYPQRLVKLARLGETLDYYVPNGVGWRVLLWDSTDPQVIAARPAS